MTRNGTIWMTAGLVTAIAALAIGQARLDASAGALVEAPRFEVDPFWPKPLPNNWIMGPVIGVSVDSRDHVFIIHRPTGNLNAQLEAGAEQDSPTSECCVGAPPVLEFDPAGNLVKSWGGPGEGYTWPASNHGITIDQYDNLWIGGNGNGDSHILKFTRDGRFLMQIGTPGQQPESNSMTHFGRVAKISFDLKSDEAYVADGYGDKRVAVLDINTGAIKRYWGAYGNRPDDAQKPAYSPNDPPSQQFRNPVHCAEPSNDGLLYVCDRPSDRIQVFRRDGTFVMEKVVWPATLGDGSAFDLVFSRDPDQRYIFLADGSNEKIHVLDRRTLEEIYAFGSGGRNPGQFFAVHSIAMDSKGNLYTGETYEGKRLQKFIYRGMGPVTSINESSPWPQR